MVFPRPRWKDWPALLRTIGHGMTTSCSAAAARAEEAVAGGVRSRQSRPRRIAVLGSNGGVGTTTVAALVASVLAAARDDQTLLVTVVPDAADGAARLAVPHAPTVTEVVAGLRTSGRIPPTPLTRNGLRVLSAPRPGSVPDEAELAALLDAAASGHASSVVDLGVAGHRSHLGATTGLFDTVLLVSRSTAAALRSTHETLRRMRLELPANRPPAAIVLTAQSRIAAAGHTRGGTAEVDGGVFGVLAQWERLGVRTHAVPHDAGLASGGAIELPGLSERSRIAVLSLAAELMRPRSGGR